MKKHVLPIVMLSLAVVMMNGCSLLLPAPKASDIHYNYDLKHYPHIVRQNTQQLYDDFKKETWIYGPKLGASGQYQLLRAWANSKKVVDFIQLYVRHFVWEPSGYDFNSAYDLNGKKLNFVKVRYESDWDERYMGEEEGTLMVRYSADDAAVYLSYRELVKHRETGLTVKFYGKNGDRVYEMPAVYIDDFLSVLEEGYTGLK